MSDYDMSIHRNPDAQVWAKFFSEKFKVVTLDGTVVEDSECLMIAWFANAMMAMYDYIEGNQYLNGDHMEHETSL